MNKLAFEISGYDSVDWDNASIADKLPINSEQLIKIFFDKCFKEFLFNFIVFPAEESNIFSHKMPLATICTDKELIKNNLDYFIQLMLTKKGSIIGIDGELQTFIDLFKGYGWTVTNVQLIKAEAGISTIFDKNTLSTMPHLSSKNLGAVLDK